MSPIESHFGGKGKKVMEDMAASYGPGGRAKKPAFMVKAGKKMPKKVVDLAAQAAKKGY